MFKYESIVGNEFVTFFDKNIIDLEKYANDLISINGDVNFVTKIIDMETNSLVNCYRFIKLKDFAIASDLNGKQKPVCVKIEF